jgi:hypothetical protein
MIGGKQGTEISIQETGAGSCPADAASLVNLVKELPG